MLGAQARAAELQAAKSAAMRQRAHHETEELTMPTEPVSVLLTDFVRNPLLNKNKGVKAFRPLIDSDFEGPVVQTGQETPGSGTPSRKNTQLALLETAPVAPRAMLVHPDLYKSRTTPSRVHAPTFTPQSKIANLSVKPSTSYSGLVPASPYTDVTQEITGHVFGPEDLSPAKQENKINEIREQCGDFSATQKSVQHFSTPSMFDTRAYTPQHNYSYETHLHHVDRHLQTSYDSSIFNRPSVQQYQSEVDISTAGYGSVQTHAERTHLFAEDLMDHQMRLQQHPLSREPLKTRTSIVETDEPYDRHSKMQSFVAAQQAMARKGKTVLHNPDLHRSPHPVEVSILQSLTPSTTVMSNDQTNINISDSIMEETAKPIDPVRTTGIRDGENVSRATMEQDVFKADIYSGLTFFNRDDSVKLETTEIYGDKSLLSMPLEMVTKDWYTLRPITERERQAFLYVTRKKAIPSLKDSYYPFNGGPTSLIGTAAREWLLQDCAFHSIRRTAIAGVVDKYEKGKLQSSAYGIIGKPLSKDKSDLNRRGGLRAVANIMATLHDCSDDSRKHPELSQYTTIPEYAIDQRSDSNPSLFDDLGFEIHNGAANAVY